MPFPMVLVLALRLPQSVPSAPTRDAPSVLNAVSQRYADARSYHFEAVEEQTSSNELSRHWDKTLLTAIVMADGRYRYDARGCLQCCEVASNSRKYCCQSAAQVWVPCP
jgi:hypothetical protein